MNERTILQGLRDEIHYPMSEGYLMNRLASRGLDAGERLTPEILQGDAFNLAVADALASIITLPDMREGDKSLSFATFKNLISKRANDLYRKHGEPESVFLEQRPRVIIGG